MVAKMSPKFTPSKPGFQHPIPMSNIVEVYWLGSGDKRSSDEPVVRAHVRYLCQNRPKTEAHHPPRPQGSSFPPQILPATYLYDVLGSNTFPYIS